MCVHHGPHAYGGSARFQFIQPFWMLRRRSRRRHYGARRAELLPHLIIIIIAAHTPHVAVMLRTAAGRPAHTHSIRYAHTHTHAHLHSGSIVYSGIMWRAHTLTSLMAAALQRAAPCALGVLKKTLIYFAHSTRTHTHTHTQP